MNADEARQAVRRVKREGADFVKVYNLLSDLASLTLAMRLNRDRPVTRGTGLAAGQARIAADRLSNS